MGRDHLVSTKPLWARCTHCGKPIWFAWDEGMPVYCDPDPLNIWQEIAAKVSGKMTFNLYRGVGIWLRDEYGIHRDGIVVSEHAHRAGITEMGKRCPTGTSKRVTDLKDPPF